MVYRSTVKPASYNEEKDAGGFCAWAMRTDDLSIPYASEDERRYTLNEEWKKVAVQNPYTGFTFDDTDVSAELSAISNVNSQLGMQIMLGKTAQDPKDAVAELNDGVKMVYRSTKTIVLQALNNRFSFGTDAEFAKEIFNIPLPERYQWLENRVDECLRQAGASFEDYNEVIGFVERLKGGRNG